MKAPIRLLVAGTFVVLGLAPTRAARAQQHVLLDVSYTHSKDVVDSGWHYNVATPAGAPKNWVSPVPYAKGKMHAYLEVLTKPGSTPTTYRSCFQGSGSYACMSNSPVYTTIGTHNWSQDISAFYLSPMVDWSKGVSKMYLVVKTANNQKPSNSNYMQYMPTKVRFVLTMVPPGATYTPPKPGMGAPPAGDAGATATDAGGNSGARDAGGADAGNQMEEPPPGTDAAAATVDAAASSGNEKKDATASTTTPPAPDSGTSTGTRLRDAQQPEPDPAPGPTTPPGRPSGGCSMAAGELAPVGGGSVLFALALGLTVGLARSRRRRR